MALSLKHAFQSAKTDGADSTLVQPSNWNADHTLTGSNNVLFGTNGSGAGGEITVSTGLSLSSSTLTVTFGSGGAQAYDADLAAIAALAGTSGFLKKTGADTWTLDTTSYLASSTVGTSVQAYDADLAAIAALSGTSGLLKKTAADTWTLDTTSYLSGTIPISTGVSGLGTGVATAAGNAVDASGGLITYSTYAPASGKTLTVSNSITLAGTDSTTMTFPGASASIGYLNVPQVGGAEKTSSYTAVLADSGSMIVMNGASLTATIPANSSVAYAVGTVLTFVNIYAGNLSIAITTDTMTLVNTASTTGTRTLAQNGIATAVKVSSTSWIISGSGLT